MEGGRKTVLVFGTFDGLHEGHRFFLTHARALGTTLVASVATDEVIERLKGYRPKQNLRERIRALEESGLVDRAVEGDPELNSWNTIKILHPDIVALGYDQIKLEEKLRKFVTDEKLSIEIIQLKALEPSRFHSRFLRKK